MATHQELPLFLDLNEKVRAKILNILPQGDVLRLREVCNQLKAEVDRNYEFTYKLDDSKEEEVQRMVKFKIRHLVLISLNTESNYVPLQFPNYVKTLQLHTPDISANKLHELLTQISANLISLDIKSKVVFYTPTANVGNSPFPRYIFNKLRTLKFADAFAANQIRSGVEHQGPGGFFNRMIISTLCRLNINLHIVPCRLKKDSNHQGVCSVWTINILNLIASSAPWIADIQIRLIEYCTSTDLVHGAGSPAIEKTKLGTVQGIRTVFLNVKIKESLMQHFYTLLLQQSGIQVLQMSDVNTPVLFPPGLHRQLILNNSSQLREIIITDFGNSGTLGEEQDAIPFDMTTFQECQGLQAMKLARNLSKRPRGQVAELVNLANLPSHLVEIQFIDFLIGTLDLIQFFNQRQSTERIEIVALRIPAPIHTGLGIEFEVLNALLVLPNIQRLYLKTFNFPVPQNLKDWTQLLHQLEDYKLPFEEEENANSEYPSHFLHIKRKTVKSPWKHSNFYHSLTF